MNNRDMAWVVASLQKRLLDTKFRDRDTEPTIYKVPDILKNVDPQAYEPFLVSLGPYHFDKPHLQAMNQVKWKYLKFVLEKIPDVNLTDYVDRIKNLETQARDAYSEKVKMSSNRFLEMMLLDGCYVMLIIIGCNIVTENISGTQFEVRREWGAIIESYFKTKISVENTLLTRSVVVRDIFMLENQLPFFLLETLYESAFPADPPFRKLTLEFIRKYTSSNLELPSNDETFHHIIHFFHSCIDPTRNHGNGNQSSTFGNLHVPDLSSVHSATVFNEAGIRFERKQRDKSFLDITFHNGKLEIPQLRIDDGTNSLLRNLIAYEQCSMDFKFHVTSYMMFMNCLIKTAADVKLLQQHEIIIGDLGDSQEIATLFNKLGTYVGNNRVNFYLKDVVTAMKSTTTGDTTNDAQG